MQRPYNLLYTGLSNQRTTCSSRRRSGEWRSSDSHLEWPPRIMGFIDARNVCQKEVITFSRIGKSTHNKRREDGSNWRSSYHHPKKIPQVMRNMKNSILEETLIHLSIWIRNDQWRRWWSWRLKKESTHETNKDKYSIVISWYCFVMNLFIFNWCIIHDRMFALMTVYY